MKELSITIDDLAKKLAEKLEGADVKLPTMIDGFKALSAHYIAVSKPVKAQKSLEKPSNGEDFGAMQGRIAEAEKQGKAN